MIKFDDSFNWLAVLKDLAAGMPISRLDHIELAKLSQAWPTCACGQLCKLIPREASGTPQDPVLYELGIHFHSCIQCKHWSEALKAFHEIETRTDYLLEKMSVHEYVFIPRRT